MQIQQNIVQALFPQSMFIIERDFDREEPNNYLSTIQRESDVTAFYHDTFDTAA